MPNGLATRASCGAMPAASGVTTSRVFFPSVRSSMSLPAWAPHRSEIFLTARPHVRCDSGAAVIADRLHGDETGAAGTHQVLAETGIGLFGFLVAVGADEAVEDLPERQWQVI